jgi:hypothetical protein
MKRYVGTTICAAIVAWVSVSSGYAASIGPPAALIVHKTTHVSSDPVSVSDASTGALIICLVSFLMIANVGCIGLAIAMSFRRSLSFDTADGWEHPQYLRALPNILAALHTCNSKTLWPKRCTPWSMRHFERRLRRAVRPCLRNRTEPFIGRHMSLWIWLESHRSECRQWVRERYFDWALDCLSTSCASQHRAEVLALLNAASPPDSSLQNDQRTGLRLARLQRLLVIMREHGFKMSTDFDQLDSFVEKVHPEPIDLRSTG